jgi:Kdo2-lipid IVA lauroyltransferase/acyltransferase
MKWLGMVFSHAGVLFMRLIAPLPLPLLRGMGWLLGMLLYGVAYKRRHIVRTNLTLCFQEHSAQQICREERQIFIFFAQSWLDRSWLWHGSSQQLEQRLHLAGEHADFAGNTQPVVLFAPHFMGLDAGWIALNTRLQPSRTLSTLYAAQINPVVDAWILQGRGRWGSPRLFSRDESVREIASSLKSGVPLYLLPDMDLGARNSIFVPFFGIEAATVPSLGRFAKMANAQVRSVHTLLTPQGYSVTVSSPWDNFPDADMTANTARMNTELEAMIRIAPAQYYWVHKRFKTRSPGSPAVY